MITFKKFLLENGNEEEPHEDFVKFLLENCKPFLQSYKTAPHVFTRGMNKLTGKQIIFINNDGTERFEFNGYTVKTRKDRRPLSSDTKSHEAFDNWFLQKFGKRYRSQSVFCFTENVSPSLLATYGKNKCIIIPIGDFTFAWSSDVSDAYSDLGDIEELINSKTPMPDYKESDLNGASDSKNEIMVYCDNYLYIRYASAAVPSFRKITDILDALSDK